MPPASRKARLIVFSGLPGSGKTTLAKALAQEIQAVYLRIDSIEEGLRASVLNVEAVEDAGYLAAYKVAADNLTSGLTVIADCVNPIELTREAWQNTARENGFDHLFVYVLCSDASERRSRLEIRESGNQKKIQDMMEREFEPWQEPVIEIDTTKASVQQSLNKILAEIKSD